MNEGSFGEKSPGVQKFEVVSAEDGKNCIKIKQGEIPGLLDIVGAAIASNAVERNEGQEEAGDDRYLIQFPGHGPEWLEQDEILGRLREWTEGPENGE